MDIVETKPTFHTTHSVGDFDGYDNLINPLESSNYQAHNLVNIKTDPDSIKSVQYNDSEIFSESPLSKISDANDSTELDLYLLSTPFIKNDIKFSSDEALIQKLPIFMNIKKEIFDTEHKYDNLINPLGLCNYQTGNLVNIKTDPDTTRSVQCNNIQIFSETPLSKICDKKESMKLNFNYLSTQIIEHESVDIKVETHGTESTSMTTDLETSLISIKDESFRKLEDFEDASCAENLAESWNSFIHICKICNKAFYHEENLKHHKQTVHLKFKHAKCTYCDKYFTQMYNLKVHEKTVHLKIKDWKCNLCDKFFTVKSHLKTHEKALHLKIRDWKCNLCDKYFAEKSGLRRHEKAVHLKIKNWKCNICEKTFARKVNLESHSKVHSNDFSEVCKICNKKFRNLKSHQNNVHSETRVKNLKCIHCDKAFLKKNI